MADILPMIRNIRRAAKEAGLAGEDKISKLHRQWEINNEALWLVVEHIKRVLPIRRPDWSTAVLCALIIVAFFAGGLLGWQRHEIAVLHDCISQIQVVQGQQACWVTTKSLY